jgi:hypothetical protein
MRRYLIAAINKEVKHPASGVTRRFRVGTGTNRRERVSRLASRTGS